MPDVSNLELNGEVYSIKDKIARDKADSNTSNIEILTDDVANVKNNVSSLTNRTDALSGRMNNAENNISELSESINVDMRELANEVDGLSNDVSQQEQTLNTFVTDARERFENINDSIEDLNDKDRVIDGNIETVREDINNLETRVSDVESTTAEELVEIFGDQIDGVVTNWLNDNVDPAGSAVAIDSSLSISGMAADAKVTGDKINDNTKIIENMGGTLYFESGSYADADGKTKVSRVDRLRNNAPIPRHSFLRIMIPSGYERYVFYLDRNMNLLGHGSWGTGAVYVELLRSDCYFINISIRKTGATTSDISGDVISFNSNLSYYSEYNVTVREKTELSSTSDLNDVKEVGLYYFSGNSVPVNSPKNSAGVLEVIGFGAPTTCTQIIHYYNLSHSYIRYHSSSNVWSNWQELSTTGIIETLDAYDDLDNILDEGKYFAITNDMPLNAPNNERALIQVIKGNSDSSGVFQLWWEYAKNRYAIRCRFGGVWYSWRYFPTISATYANSSEEGTDLDDILPYLSDIRRGGTLDAETNLNDIKQHGMYYYSGSSLPSNAPFSANSLVQVFGGTSTTSSVIQRAYCYIPNREGIATRYLYLNEWSEWVYDGQGSSGSGESYISGAGVNVRFPLNDSYSSSDPNPYTYHNKVVTLAHISDIHSHAENYNEFMNWANDNNSLYDDVLCTGDIVEWYNEESADPSAYLNFWKSKTNWNKILVTIGNHDAKNEQSSSHDGWVRKTVARSRELYMSTISDWNVVSPTGKTWWYKDYQNCDLRLIGLDTTVVYDSDDDVEQLNWLNTVLTDALSAGKSVVIAEHYQPANGVSVDCDFNSENRPIWSTSYFRMNYKYQQNVQNFINNNGKFVCWLCGHTHADFVAYNSDYPDQLFFVVTSLWNDLRTSDQARTQGTPSFIACNLIGFDIDRGLIKLVRCGANYDFNLRPRNIMVYDYINKRIVRQSSGMSM